MVVRRSDPKHYPPDIGAFNAEKCLKRLKITDMGLAIHKKKVKTTFYPGQTDEGCVRVKKSLHPLDNVSPPSYNPT